MNRPVLSRLLPPAAHPARPLSADADAGLAALPGATLSRRRLLLGTASLGAGALLAACGGGGGDPAGADAGPTEAPAGFTQGPISGFGSLIVGGIRFDDDAAQLLDEDGDPVSRDEFKLGVLVDVDSRTINRAEMRAVALRIALGGALVGPVDAVDAAAGSLTLLGQRVLVTPSTVFDEALAGGLAAVVAGDVLRVWGLFDRVNARFVATRIEPRPGAVAYRLRGIVSDLDTVARTFRLGGVLVSYASVPAAGLRTTPANGAFVRVRLQTVPVGGAWVATHLARGPLLPGPRPDAQVEGLVTAFTSATDFEVNGLRVDARGAAFPDGSDGIVLGARVEVSGAIVDGVLVARRVELAERRYLGRLRLEFHGPISRLDTAARLFALRGLTIWYGGSVVFANGSEADLADGRRVEVRGVVAVDRTRIEALRIRFL